MEAKPMVIAAARVLARRHAEACNVDAEDVWNLHAEDFTQDAEAALSAAGAPELLDACKAIVEYQRLIESDAVGGLLEAYAKAFEGSAAAVAKATGESA